MVATPPFETEERSGYKTMPSPLWRFRFKVAMDPSAVSNVQRFWLEWDEEVVRVGDGVGLSGTRSWSGLGMVLDGGDSRRLAL